MLSVTTLPVLSRLADPADVAAEQDLASRLPSGLRLSQHQLATYRALRDREATVVINTAMTGDGKSLAALLPLLANQPVEGVLSLYPTNELVQDQLRSARHWLEQWQCPSDWVATLFGARLDELVDEAQYLQRADVVQKLLADHCCLLSNPDIVHAIMQFYYQRFGRSRDAVIGDLTLQFQQAVFDEFHVFAEPQIIAVLTALLFWHAQQPALKALFLSATPQPQLVDLLHKLGYGSRIRLIDPQDQGWYHHGSSPSDGWRLIARAVQLDLLPGTVEEWVAGGGDQAILKWLLDRRPAAKGALIVNSVATAHRLFARLQPLFARHNLTVALNTGITGPLARSASYDADLLIGTSTIDIGVDFHINLLVFEAGSAGAFLQRLGRLGRHDGYHDVAGQFHRFVDFKAFALVPQFVYERLTATDQALQSGAELTRPALAQAIQAAFPLPIAFHHYGRLWGRFIPARVYLELSREPLRTSYANVRTQLRDQYGQLVNANIAQTCRELQAHDAAIIREAQSFRGSSGLMAAVVKDNGNDQGVIGYDLFWLLANAQLELLDKTDFKQAALRLGWKPDPFLRGFHHCFFRWCGLRAQREQVSVLLPGCDTQWLQMHQQKVLALLGLQVDVNGHGFLNKLNCQLQRVQMVVCFIPTLDPLSVRRRLYLPPTFQLLPYRVDTADAGEQRGTIAIGRDALLLDSILRYRQIDTGVADAPLIF